MKYRRQVELLVEALPFVFEDSRFAMKGGTALNLFLHDMPRLSVDIDITYLPIEDRATSFRHMHEILKLIQSKLKRSLGCEVTATQPLDGKKEVKLLVARDGVEIKIEPNFTIRGAVFPPENMALSPKCVEAFNQEVNVPCLSRADLYGGKICAALDRQHPRDLFDVMIFFETGGFDRQVVDAFVYYLLSHNRPFHEVLDPRFQDLQGDFDLEFTGMTEKAVELGELEKVRKRLIETLLASFSDRDKEFLMSAALGKPDWTLYAHPVIQSYPSVLWRFKNMGVMGASKLEDQMKELGRVLVLT